MNGDKAIFKLRSVEDTNSLWNTLELLQNQVRELVDEGGPAAHPVSLTGARIAKILRARAMRAKFFNKDLFADPAWDMLLDLYRQHCDQHQVSVTSVCLASGVPSTTALRWLLTLETDGLIARHQDPSDGRRCFVSLSPKAIEAIESYFAAIGDTQPI